MFQETLPEITNRTEELIATELKKKGLDFRGIPTNYNGFMKCKNCIHFKHPQIEGKEWRGQCSKLDIGIFNIFQIGGALTIPPDYICHKYQSQI